MDKAVAIAVMAQWLQTDRMQTVVADIDWNRLHPLLALTPTASLVAAMAPRSIKQDVALDAGDLAFKAHWQTLPAHERSAALLVYLREQLAKALHLDLNEVDIQQPLINTGMDSLMAVGFRQRIQHVTGLEIPVVLVLGGASLETLATRLATSGVADGTITQSTLSDGEPIFTESHVTDVLVEGVL